MSGLVAGFRVVARSRAARREMSTTGEHQCLRDFSDGGKG